MPSLKVVNIKCGGCEQNIISSLEKKGLKNIKVNVAKQTISFNGDVSVAKKKLSQMGYPPADSKEANSLLKKTKSYVSCVIGKAKKK